MAIRIRQSSLNKFNANEFSSRESVAKAVMSASMANVSVNIGTKLVKPDFSAEKKAEMSYAKCVGTLDADKLMTRCLSQVNERCAYTAKFSLSDDPSDKRSVTVKSDFRSVDDATDGFLAECLESSNPAMVEWAVKTLELAGIDADSADAASKAPTTAELAFA
mgnify:FL=1